jgi:hypothetical protein
MSCMGRKIAGAAQQRDRAGHLSRRVPRAERGNGTERDKHHRCVPSCPARGSLVPGLGSGFSRGKPDQLNPVHHPRGDEVALLCVLHRSGESVLACIAFLLGCLLMRAIVAGPMPYPMRAGMQVAYLHTPRGRAVYSTQGGCGHAGRVALVGMGAFQVRPREH